ncbi:MULTISPECIES: hypothetical protein [unclassified Tolypothrix]|uniref:hypothetical protein n=1 Tax=unclassified Tolypothrix TaxID=2649714 RepID=UPI0005EAA830|nr:MULTISPECIES: hypothetical protein [unclassified Tolypothrix]BAY90792.1 hypothetical protein NIES3275_28090 [Microchaete diplosiphon NIES-3275]EKF04360.1 hypothetical protein FDUTEX481_02039 [Tolypothrix sp. PCC 7601]MBE9081007.1 hypothetical protein [Tolypothrix sp. LEGE 11397]UYD24926.1 hypothetical protein HGR01_26445 [Tolypothrix sp. PCC 7712]UYD32841.1 hypothetical protein HG267_28190 [Tolypothrix sp. PCC 7601]
MAYDHAKDYGHQLEPMDKGRKRVIAMTVTMGRRMATTGVIHLTEESPNEETWLTLCGRKIRAAQALPLEEFAGGNCCVYCTRVQRSNELLRSRLGAA